MRRVLQIIPRRGSNVDMPAFVAIARRIIEGDLASAQIDRKDLEELQRAAECLRHENFPAVKSSLADKLVTAEGVVSQVKKIFDAEARYNRDQPLGGGHLLEPTNDEITVGKAFILEDLRRLVKAFDKKPSAEFKPVDIQAAQSKKFEHEKK